MPRAGNPTITMAHGAIATFAISANWAGNMTEITALQSSDQPNESVKIIFKNLENSPNYPK